MENIKAYILKNDLLSKIIFFFYNIMSFKRKKIKGKNNTLLFSNAILKNINLDIQGNNNTIEIDNFTRLTNATIRIRGDNHKLYIGEKCNLKNITFWITDENCIINIGDKTTIEGAELASIEPYSKITIGNDCMLSRNIEMRTGDSHSIIDLETNNRINYPGNINIANHVWIGAHVKVLKGVNIGQGSVVGLGTIVTKSIPDNVIYGGIPAKLLKKNVNWDRERLE